MIKFSFISLFPEVIEPYMGSSMMWKAQKDNKVKINFINLRDFGIGTHKSVDDTPYGGGDGMLMSPEPVVNAIESVKKIDKNAIILLPTPVGFLWNQHRAEALVKGNIEDFFNDNELIDELKIVKKNNSENNETSVKKIDKDNIHYVIFCPRYEGVDERIMDYIDLPICVGQYIVTGGELPALVIADSIIRLIPGVLGGEESALIESFSDGDNLEFPQWTKPANWRGMEVPEILLSGHHKNIADWREEQARLRKKYIIEKYKQKWNI